MKPRLAPLFLAALGVWSMDPPPRGGQLQLALPAEPKTLHPLQAADEPSEIVRYLTGGVLIRLNRATQALEAELAARWRLSPDGKAITFELRRGVSFSDGTPFGPADVCFTLDRLLDPGLASPIAEPFRHPAGRPLCRLEGEARLSVRFPVAIAGLERLFDGVSMLSARSPQKERACLGPFVIAEHQPGAYLVLRRNPRYWKRDASGTALPYLETLRLEVQRNRDLEIMRFRRGEMHLVNNLDPELFEKLKVQMPQAVYDLGVSLDTEQLWFNQSPAAPMPAHKKAWFASMEFRRAVSDAIRREDIVKVVYRGHAAPALGPVSPANKFWFARNLPAPGGPAAARARLQRDGFVLRGGMLHDRAGNPVQFSIATNAGNKARERIAALIQQDLAAIGIRVTIATLDFPSLLDRMTRTLDYEACLLGLVHSDLDPNSHMSFWMSSSANHPWHPSQKSPATPWEAEIDRLLMAQAAEARAEKRKQAFDRVQQILAREAPMIFLVHRNALVASSARLRNLQPTSLRPQTLWNVEHLYFARD